MNGGFHPLDFLAIGAALLADDRSDRIDHGPDFGIDAGRNLVYSIVIKGSGFDARFGSAALGEDYPVCFANRPPPFRGR